MSKKENKSKKIGLSSLSPEQKRIALFVSLAAFVVVLLSALLWQLIITKQNQQRFNIRLNELIENQSSTVINYQFSFYRQMSEYAAQYVKLFDNQSSESEQAVDNSKLNPSKLYQEILSASPHIKSVRFYMPRQAQNEKNQGGAIGFVELDMINRAEQGKAVFAEVSKAKNNEGWLLHWVMPVYKDAGDGKDKKVADDIDQPIAVLHISMTTLDLEQSFAQYDARLGRLMLTQKIGRQKSLGFLSIGQGSGYGLKEVVVPDSHWVISIAPSKYFFGQSSTLPLWFVGFVLVAFALLLPAAYYLAQKKNKQQAALYKALNVNVATKSEKSEVEEEGGSDQEELSDPIYLADQQLEVDAEDQALIAGEHQAKQEGSMLTGDSGSANSGDLSDAASTDDALSVPSHIFRAYDIRGLVDSDLTVEVAEAVGKAVASEALGKSESALIVGYDARTHSSVLCHHLKQGILSTGCDVIDIGLVPTPLMNFATVFSDRTSSGIIVTASHNPKEYNGFKVVIDERTLVDDDIQRLQQRISKGLFVKGDSPGQLSEEEFSEDYIDTIAADIAINADMHIVIDAANGAAGKLAPALFEELGCNITELFCEFDGEFPHHDPDPSVADNLSSLIEKVKEVDADLGVALDGDGDRLVVVTSAGEIIWPDQLLMLFARDVVSRNPGCDVIFDIKSTRQLNQVVSSYGGRPIMWKTGHSHIKSKMKETDALLAGEFSGHIFFKERWFGFDDGIYAAARLMEIMSLRDQSLDDMLSSLPRLSSTPEIKITVTEDSKFTLVERLIKEGDFASGEKTTIDGLRVDFAKGWGLIRASNTAPALTLRFEADSDNGVDQLKTLFKRELQKLDAGLSLDF